MGISAHILFKRDNSIKINQLLLRLSELCENEGMFYSHTLNKGLSELSVRLEDHKFIGHWQIGHVALATLALLDNQHANDKFNELHGRLNENDRFLVQHFIDSEVYTD